MKTYPYLIACEHCDTVYQRLPGNPYQSPWSAQRSDALGRGCRARAQLGVPLAAFSIIVAPLLQIALLGWVLGFARAGRRAPGFSQVMRLLNHLRPWCMIEVCMLGTLVAVIKLSSFLQVLPGAGIWGMAVLMALLALIANRDMRWLWELSAQLHGNEVRA